MNKKKILGALIITAVMMPMAVAIGQGPGAMWSGPEDIINFLRSIMDWIWRAASIIVVIFLIYAGFLFVTAGGDTTRVGSAKDMLKWALIGVVVMILAGSVMGVMTGLLAS